MADLNNGGYGTTSIFVRATRYLADPEVTRIREQSKGTTLAHRIAWVIAGRPLADGMHLDHMCDNPPCVNPDHIQQVLPAVNNMRSRSATALNARKTHCARGHEFDLLNTVWTPSGGRKCRACYSVIYRQRRGSVSREDLRISDAYRKVIRGEACNYCGKPSVAADHYYSSMKRPGDYWWRLVPTCTACNSKKSSMCGTAFKLVTAKAEAA
jgi:5-methylcytosine-specific restriction endonuclease McrA